MTHKTAKIISLLKGRGYNTQFSLYPQYIYEVMKLLFAVYMCHSTMDLTRCYKTAVL